MEEILLKTILAEKEKVLTTNIEAVSIISTPPPSHLRVKSIDLQFYPGLILPKGKVVYVENHQLWLLYE